MFRWAVPVVRPGCTALICMQLAPRAANPPGKATGYQGRGCVSSCRPAACQPKHPASRPASRDAALPAAATHTSPASTECAPMHAPVCPLAQRAAPPQPSAALRSTAMPAVHGESASRVHLHALACSLLRHVAAQALYALGAWKVSHPASLLIALQLRDQGRQGLHLQC